MTNRPNVKQCRKNSNLALIGARISSEIYGSLDEKWRKSSRFKKLDKPDFHETMFQAGRDFCEASEDNYHRMRSLFLAYVSSEIKDKSRKVQSRFYHPDGNQNAGFATTKALNLKFTDVDTQEEMTRFGEEPHEYAIRCAIYVLAGRREVNGAARIVQGAMTYTT